MTVSFTVIANSSAAAAALSASVSSVAQSSGLLAALQSAGLTLLGSVSLTAAPTVAAVPAPPSKPPGTFLPPAPPPPKPYPLVQAPSPRNQPPPVMAAPSRPRPPPPSPPASAPQSGCAPLSPCWPGNSSAVPPIPAVACTLPTALQKVQGVLFICGACPPGFSGSGIGQAGCEDIDECLAGNGGCDDLTQCNNTLGGFTCGPCSAGYLGSGLAGCRAAGSSCAESNGGCDPLTNCTDSQSGPLCGPCPYGYTGSGTTGCTDTDGCNPTVNPSQGLAGVSPCFPGSLCADLPAASLAGPAADPRGAGFTCGPCPDGYSGNGLVCTSCPLAASIPSASFAPGASPLSSKPITLFGVVTLPSPLSTTAAPPPPPPAAALPFVQNATAGCSAGSGLSIAWTAATADGVQVALPASSAAALTLVIAPRTLAPGSYSRLTLQACFAANPDPALCGSASLAFTPAAAPITAVLTGANTVVGHGLVTLSAAQSEDPDSLPGSLQYNWSCAVQQAGTTGCAAVDGRALIPPSGAIWALQLQGSAGGTNYTFAVTVSKGARSSTVAAQLVVRSGVSLPVISCSTPSDTLVLPSAKLVLPSSVASAYPGNLSHFWVVASPPKYASGGAADLLATPGAVGTPVAGGAFAPRSLVVNPGFLPPQTTLLFSMVATDPGGSASVNISVTVAGYPFGRGGPGSVGSVSVQPQSGFGLSTSFNLAAVGWTDTPADSPLLYSFAFSLVGSSAAPVTLSDFGPMPALSAPLPAGLAAGNNSVVVLVFVANALGAISSATSMPVTDVGPCHPEQPRRARVQPDRCCARRPAERLSKRCVLVGDRGRPPPHRSILCLCQRQWRRRPQAA